MEGNLKDHVDAQYVDLQKIITKSLNISSTGLTPLTQQSQPHGLANGSVKVKKNPLQGVGYKLRHQGAPECTILNGATQERRTQR